MKKIWGSIVILAVIMLGGYYGSGLIAQRTLNSNVALLNDTNGLSVQIRAYKRGLFVSQAQLVWQIQTPEQLVKDAQGVSTLFPAKTFSVDMPLDIYHGPILFTPHGVYFGLACGSSQINIPAEYMAQFRQGLAAESTQPKLNLSVFISFLDTTTLRVEIPAFRLILKQDASQLEWLGLLSEHHFSASLEHISGSLLLNGLRLTQQTEGMTLGQVTSNYNLHRNADGLYLGDLSLSIPSLVGAEQGQSVFELTGLELSNSSDVAGGLFSSSIHASFISALLGHKTYGPARVGFSINNLDASVLAEINAKVNQAHQLSDAARQNALLGLLPMLPKLFAQGAGIEVTDLNVVLPEGAVQGDLHVQLPKNTVNNPLQWLQQVVGEGQFKLPMAALKALYVQSIKQRWATQQHAAVNTTPPEASPSSAAQVPPVTSSPPPVASVNDEQALAEIAAKQKIAALLKAGALVINGQDYVIQIKIASGQLLVNGHPFDSAMLQF